MPRLPWLNYGMPCGKARRRRYRGYWRAGIYLRQFHRSHGLDIGDALIAATAAVHGCALWTRNHKHYPMKDIELI